MMGSPLDPSQQSSSTHRHPFINALPKIRWGWGCLRYKQPKALTEEMAQNTFSFGNYGNKIELFEPLNSGISKKIESAVCGHPPKITAQLHLFGHSASSCRLLHLKPPLSSPAQKPATFSAFPGPKVPAGCFPYTQICWIRHLFLLQQLSVSLDLAIPCLLRVLFTLPFPCWPV